MLSNLYSAISLIMDLRRVHAHFGISHLFGGDGEVGYIRTYVSTSVAPCVCPCSPEGRNCVLHWGNSGRIPSAKLQNVG